MVTSSCLVQMNKVVTKNNFLKATQTLYYSKLISSYQERKILEKNEASLEGAATTSVQVFHKLRCIKNFLARYDKNIK